MLPMQTNSTANSAFGINDLGLKILFKKPLLLSTIQHKPECYESTAYSIVLNPAFGYICTAQGEMMDDAEKLKEQFKLICRKCGSENVAVNIEDGINYGGQTGYQQGSIQIGCNDCAENDWMVWI